MLVQFNENWTESFSGWHGQKTVRPILWWDLKIECVSEEWTDGLHWFFACWYRFTKIKSWSKIYWVGMVENGCGKSVHETLKSAVS